MAYKNATQPKNDLLNNFDLACISINLLILFIIPHTYTQYAFILCCQLLCYMFGNFVVSSCVVFLFSSFWRFISSQFHSVITSTAHMDYLCGVYVWNKCSEERKEWQQWQRQDTAIFINIHKLKCSRKVFCILIIDGTHDVISFNLLPLLFLSLIQSVSSITANYQTRTKHIYFFL